MNANLEEQFKKSAGDASTLKVDIEKLTVERTALDEKLKNEGAGVSQQVGGFDKELKELQATRTELVANLEKRMLTTYDRIRGARAGLGFAPAAAGRCTGCNIFVPAQLFNEIQKALVVHQCPSCHRILYVPGDRS